MTDARKPLPDRIRSVLEESGINDNPAEFDSDIHSWRCAHPDRYGRCSCFQELVDDLVAVVNADTDKETP